MGIAVIFGGSGFIGSHLAHALAADRQHDEVVSVDLVAPRAPVEGVRHLEWDMRSPLDPARIGGRVTDIYNLAAVHVTPGHDDWEYFGTNVSCATNVCRFATDAGVSRLTFISSIAIYGPTEQPVDEDAAPLPETAYGRSKLQAEEIHRSWQNEHRAERRLTIVRPGVVYGPSENGNFVRLARLLERRLFVYPGRTDTVKACGYVKELITAILFMQQRNEDVSLFNFCHPSPLTTREICAALCEVGGFSTPRIVVPRSLMRGVAFGSEIANAVGFRNAVNRSRVDKLTRSTHVLPRRLHESGYRFAYGLTESLSDWMHSSGRGRFE